MLCSPPSSSFPSLPLYHPSMAAAPAVALPLRAPSTPLARSIQYALWVSALDQFDGHTPVRVLKQYTQQGVWLYTIELVDDAVSCVTRLNGAVVAIVAASRFAP
jgi:hypothetical protein